MTKKETQRDLPTCYFTQQMPAKTRAGPGQSKVSQLSSSSLR